MYTVDDEGLEEDGTVGRGAGQFVNHNYSRFGTSGETTRERGIRRRWRDNLDGHGEGEEVSWRTRGKSHRVLKSGSGNY